MIRGFSLVEIVVSIGIVGVTLLALGALVHTAPLARMTHDKDIALAVASDELEGLRSGGYAALPPSGSFSNVLLSTLPASAGTLTVSAYNAKTKQVDVSVSWQDAGQAPQTVSLTTLITEIGGLP